MHSQPHIVAPLTIKNMFATLDTIPSLIRNQPFKADFFQGKAFGLPIRFTMVPLGFFLAEGTVTKIYRELGPGIMDALQSMFGVLQDFLVKGCVSARVVAHDKRLLRLLEDPNSPLSQKIRYYEAELQQDATVCKQQAAALLIAYKNDPQSSVLPLSNALLGWSQSANSIVSVEQQTTLFVNEGTLSSRPPTFIFCYLTFVYAGRKELHMVEETSSLTYFTSKDTLDQWINNTSIRTKLLFCLGEEYSLIHASFLQFIDAAPFLAQHGFHLGVALRGSEVQGGMILWVNYQRQEVGAENIPQILGLVMSALGGGNVVQQYFYSLLASLCLSILLPIQDVNDLIPLLKLLDTGVTCLDGLSVVECAVEISSAWKFLIFLNAVDTVGESVLALRYWKTNSQLASLVCFRDYTSPYPNFSYSNYHK